MGSQKVGQWILEDLKDKYGNPPTSEMWNFIQKLDRSSLVPCPRTADDLQMPEKGTVPREMNSFIVFRRQVAYVAKTLKSSEDGRILSKVASYIWNGASKSEKKSYSVIADELKKRHREKNPNYTYERRKRKTNEEDFIILNADTLTQTQQNKKKRKPKKSTNEPSTVHQQECDPISTVVVPEQEWQFNDDNSLTSQVDCVNPIFSIDDECCYVPQECIPQGCIPQVYIPQALRMVLARDSMAELSSQINLQQQQPLEEFPFFQQMQQPPIEQQLSPYYDNFNNNNSNNNNSFYYGVNGGILNQPELLDELNYINYPQ